MGVAPLLLAGGVMVVAPLVAAPTGEAVAATAAGASPPLGTEDARVCGSRLEPRLTRDVCASGMGGGCCGNVAESRLATGAALDCDVTPRGDEEPATVPLPSCNDGEETGCTTPVSCCSTPLGSVPPEATVSSAASSDADASPPPSASVLPRSSTASSSSPPAATAFSANWARALHIVAAVASGDAAGWCVHAVHATLHRYYNYTYTCIRSLSQTL